MLDNQLWTKIDTRIFRQFISLNQIKKAMGKGSVALVLAAKGLRSLFNGLLCASFIPYIKYCHLKTFPGTIGLTVFACVLFAILKTKCITRCNKSPLMGLYVAYLFFLPAFIMNVLNLGNYQVNILFMLIFVVGLYHTDGEDFAFFEEAELELLVRNYSTDPKRRQTAYKWTGFMCQAVGSLTAFLYMSYEIESISYVTSIRVRNIFVFLHFLSIVNMTLFTLIHLIRKRQQSAKGALQHAPSPNTPSSLDKRLKAANFINGLTVGALCAPFLAYFLDLKFNIHPNTVGFVIFALFLLKGIGEEAMRRLPSLKRVFECWNVLSALSLAWVYFTTDADFSVYCVLFALPLWHFGRVALSQRLQSLVGNKAQRPNEAQGGSKTSEADAIMAAGRNWERGGTAAGILLSSFAFSILYSKSHFGYAFLLSALFKLISQIYITFFLGQIDVKKVEQSKQLIEIEPSSARFDKAQQRKNAEDKTRQNFSIAYGFLKVLPVLILACLITALSYYRTDNNQLFPRQKLSTITDPIITPPQLKHYNSSLAHMWTKEGVKRVMLVDCDKYCTKSIEKRDEYYAQMQYDSPNPEWVHFPNTGYFRNAQQLRQAVKIMAKHPQAKGFSFAWDDLLRYNKMPYEIYPLLNQAGKEYGFYYAEMPSLNIRAAQYRMLKIFTREQRKPVTLPPFVGRQPPKNYLAFQTTLKLGTNHQYLREFLLYHLRLGYDKFFLYNNDRDTSDPDFYWEYRNAGAYYQKCFTLGVEEEYQNVQEIWEEFYDHIVYIPFRRGKDYPQGESFLHYGLFYAHDAVFTSYNDLDEFLVSDSQEYLPDLLTRLAEDENTGGIRYASRNFISRICLKEQLAIQETRFLVQKFRYLTMKHTLMTRLVYDTHIHYKPPFNGAFLQYDDPRHDLRMIHYKITQTYDEFEEKVVYGTDDTLLPLVAAMKEACKGKCGDSRKITCAPEVYQQQMARYCLKK